MALARLLGRDAELAQLDAAWRATQEGEPQLVLLWGRRTQARLGSVLMGTLETVISSGLVVAGRASMYAR